MRVCLFEDQQVDNLEPLALLNIQLGYVLKMGPSIGINLLHA